MSGHEISNMGEAAALLEVRGLTVDARSRAQGRDIRIVDGVDLTIRAGERLAVVGESGSGKSITARAIMQLDPALRLGGSIRLQGQELIGASARRLRAIRSSVVSMVFQDPMTALNPLMKIGDQVAEPLRLAGVGRREARRRAQEMLDRLGVPRAAERMDAYPHEFSGGMRQRVVLATAVISGPRLLIADEPTTALDVRIQDQVLDLVMMLSQQEGMAVLLITHDLGVVAGFADRVTVMYGGRIAEQAPRDALFASPRHPYTRGLLASVPRLDGGSHDQLLPVIPGSPAPPARRPAGCAFHPRCPLAMDRCRTEEPRLRVVAPGVEAACHLAGPTITTDASGGEVLARSRPEEDVIA